jgi:hypothetical protein
MIVSAAMFPPLLVAVRDLNVLWPAVGPPETDRPLLIHQAANSSKTLATEVLEQEIERELFLDTDVAAPHGGGELRIPWRRRDFADERRQ